MKYYKIGKVSKLFGVSCETIRNYEKAGADSFCDAAGFVRAVLRY